MKTRKTILTAALAALTLFSTQAQAGKSHKPKAGGDKATATRLALRDLWTGHIFWARNVVQAAIAKDDAAFGVAEGEVVANAKAIAAAIKPYYGQAASDQLFKLLAGHYGAVKAYAVAALGKDKAGQDKATQDLTSNAGEIASFLSGANPHLPKDTLVSLLSAHGSHHLAQIHALAGKDYKQEAEIWAAMQGHILGIADALAGAIVKQFPEKF